MPGRAFIGGFHVHATMEDEDDLSRIPRNLVDDSLNGMRCHGDRCAALVGEVGGKTGCVIYGQRPDVCRACEPGDAAYQIARDRCGLPRRRAILTYPASRSRSF
jgi:uncharacterized protein